MIVISNTGPIISLLKAEQLGVLKVFGKVIVPVAVYEELSQDERFKEETEIVKNCEYITIEMTDVSESAEIIRKDAGLDYGESEAIALAEILKPDYFLVEDYRAKKYAKEQNITSIGSLAVLGMGYNKGLLTEEDIGVALNKMKEANRRISNELYQRFLDNLGIDFSKISKNRDIR